MLLINYESWHQMPDSNKNQALDNIKDREQVGRSSRQKQKFTHIAGLKSFACVAEAEELSSGQKVGRLQLFDITHRKKDGSLMTSEAGEIMEKLKDKKTEYETIASSDSSVNLEDIDNRIIAEVLGLERCKRAQLSKLLNLKRRQHREEAKAQRKYEELQLQLKEEAAAREAEQNRKYNKLQLQLQNMKKMFQQS
ncbi:hypothetical protein GOBAR_AA05955 [Gossypium barbadense]|uniref:Uncharacterized protein n=1 Tax=Gossypium barbadense TaxID=3634 RepID=A0A2P5YGA3_GOSBA|nr:hypothetical protein GOBAR_AA05955 [Gossypium barbadense]